MQCLGVLQGHIGRQAPGSLNGLLAGGFFPIRLARQAMGASHRLKGLGIFPAAFQKLLRNLPGLSEDAPIKVLLSLSGH